MAGLVVALNFRNRMPLQFVKVTHFPFRIGRAYDNDLILADDAVSAHHLQIERGEEGYRIRNLSTENGTWIDDRALGLEPEDIEIPRSLEVGHTELKLFSADTPIAPTKTKMKLTRLSVACMDIRVALVLLAVYLSLSITFTLQEQALFRDWQEILMDELFALLLPLGLATITGFVSRLLLHQWRFSLQLSIASVVFIGNTLLSEVTHVVSYLLTSTTAATVFNEVMFMAGLTLLLAWQLRAVSGMTRRRSGLTSFAIVIPIIALMNLQTILNTPEFSRQPDLHTLLRPGDVRFSRNFEDVETYSRHVSQTLREGVELELENARERNAEKPPSGGAEADGPETADLL